MKNIKKLVFTLLFIFLFIPYLSANSIIVSENTINTGDYTDGEIILDNEGDVVTFSINPNDGYYYDNVVVSYNDGTILYDNNDNVYSFVYDVSYGDVTVTCDFLQKKVLSFDVNGGENVLEDILFIPGEEIDLPTPTRSAYAFLGWTSVKDDDSTVVGNKLLDSTTLYAYWVDDFIIKNLKVTSTGISSILISYDQTDTAEYYEIYRSTKSNKGFKKVTTVKTLSYTNKKLTFDTTYYYKVRAYKVVDGVKKYTPYSKVVNTKTKVNSPNFKVNFNTYNSAKIVISKVSNANGYQIYRSESENGTYKLLTTTTKTSYVDKNLKVGKTYYYKVRAYKLKGKSKKYGSYSLLSYEVTPVTPIVKYYNDTDSSLVISASGSNGVDGYEYYSLDEFDNETYVTSSNNYSVSGSMDQVFRYNVYSYKMVDSIKVFSKPAYIEAQIKPQTPVIELVSDDFFDVDEVKVKFGNVNLNDDIRIDYYISTDGKNFNLYDTNQYVYENNVNPVKVYLFGRSSCPYTKNLIKFLNDTINYNGKYYDFSYIDLDINYNNEVLRKVVDELDISSYEYELGSTPLLVIGDTYYIGFDDEFKDAIDTTFANQYSANSGFDIVSYYNDNCYSWEKIDTTSIVSKDFDATLNLFGITKNTKGYDRFIYSDLILKNTYYFKAVVTINGKTSLESNVVSNKAYITPVISTMLNMAYGKMLYMFNVPNVLNHENVYYELYRATSKKGKYTKFKTLSEENFLGELSVPYNKTYYYKVRYYQVVNGKKIYSSFSKIYSFKNTMKALDSFPVTLLGDYGYTKIKSVSFSKYKVAGDYVFYKIKFNIKESFSTKKTNVYFWLDFYNLMDLDYADYYGRIQFTVPKGTKKNWSKTVVLKVPKSSIYYLFE